MTKEEYLEKLKIVLEANNIDNVDEIVEKYKKRFVLAKDSDMSDEEAIKILGDPEQVVKKYKKDNEEFHQEKTKTLYNLKINDAIIDELTIKSCEGNKITVDVDEELIDYLDIKQEGNSLTINDKISRSIFRKTRGSLEIMVGRDIYFDNFEINCVATDTDIETINGNTIKIRLVNGDIDIDKVTCRLFNISLVSGDADINYLKCNDLRANSVSGDINIDYVDASFAKMDTVSGDFNATGHIEEKRGSSISGDINFKEIK